MNNLLVGLKLGNQFNQKNIILVVENLILKNDLIINTPGKEPKNAYQGYKTQNL